MKACLGRAEIVVTGAATVIAMGAQEKGGRWISIKLT